MADTPAIRILLVDDHYLVRRGIRTILSEASDIEVVAEAENGRQAIAEFHAHRPDVTLMDVRMPGMDGPEAVELIVRAHPTARIIILSTYDTEEDIHRAMRAGAKGYLLKEADAREMLYAIRKVHAGLRHLAPIASEKLAARAITEELTERQIEVLRLLVQGATNADLAIALGVSDSTVRTHLREIFEKLHAKDRTEAAYLARIFHTTILKTVPGFCK